MYVIMMQAMISFMERWELILVAWPLLSIPATMWIADR